MHKCAFRWGQRIIQRATSSDASRDYLNSNMRNATPLNLPIPEEDESTELGNPVLLGGTQQETVRSPVAKFDLSRSLERLCISDVDDETLDSILLPPVNSQTLAELDFKKLADNVQLMHNLFLDETLRVEPNDKTRCKEVEENYWIEVTTDLATIKRANSEGLRGKCPRRLVVLFKELRDIVMQLHPLSPSVSFTVNEYFDLDLVVRAIETNQFDLSSFARILLRLLKDNCAPKRDKLIVKLEALADQNDIIGFLRSTIALLELMAIDQVNYYLNKKRTELHIHLPPMEKKFMSKYLREMPETLNWISRVIGDYQDELSGMTSEERTFHVYSRGVVGLLLGRYDYLTNFPEILVLDASRVNGFRTTAQDICIVACTLSAFKQVYCGSNLLQNMEQLRESLFKVLLKGEAEIEELMAEVLLALTNNTKMSPIVLSSMLDKIIDPCGQVYQIMQGRLDAYLMDRLWKRQGKLGGLKEVKSDLDSFAEGFLRMTLLHWSIHQDFYEKIVRQCS